MINEITSVNAFPTSSKVSIYQANQPIDSNKLEVANDYLQKFITSWQSHGARLQAVGSILHDRFVVIMVDEAFNKLGGCAIDSSNQFIQQLGQVLNLDFFDRMIFSYQKDGAIHTVGRDQFSSLFKNGEINDETIVFDTLVNNKGDFDGGFEKKLKDSWHKRMV